MNWIMKANILSDNEVGVYANNQLYYNLREIRFKWEVVR